MEIPNEHGHQIGEEDLPGWVVAHTPGAPAASEHAVHDGAVTPLLLADEQHNFETATRYRRSVYHLPTFASVQRGSRIEIGFSPEVEKLVLHSLRIRRDGHEFDLRAGQEVRVLNREAQMERFVFDGRLLAVLLLNDVRAGDVIDYSYSLKAIKEPLFGRLTGRFLLSGSFSAQAVRRRLIYRRDRTVYARPRGCDLQPEVSNTTGGLVACDWRLDNVKPLPQEPDTPSWTASSTWIEYGEFNAWEDVAAAATRLFTPPEDSLPAHIADWLNQWRASGASPQQFILQAIRYVQESIRYVAVSIDEHTHKPYPISTILGRNYGDCKDKATLLCRLLREAGHDAVPALVNSRLCGHAVTGLPQPEAFDHVIVRLRHAGQTHWIDATLTDQGGSLETISHPPYGFALVLGSAGEALEKIPPSPSPATVTYEEFVKVHRTDGSAELRVTRTFNGATADQMRHQLSTSGLAELDRHFLTEYQRAYPEVLPQAPTGLEDHREANRIVLVHTFQLFGIWAKASRDGAVNQARFPVFGIHPVLHLPPDTQRTLPYRIPHPVAIRASLEMRLPAGFKPARAQAAFSSSAFQAKYFRETSSNSGRVTIDYHSVRDHVPAHEIAQHRKAIHGLGQIAVFFVNGHQRIISRGFARPGRQ